jgi:hypothetical protein
MTWDWLKDLAAKAITVGVVAVGGALASGVPIEGGWALGMIFAYAVWMQVIVPKVKELFEAEGITATRNESKSRFELI